MIFKIFSKGHRNVTSHHKSTFEITKDEEIGPTADCIVGVDMDTENGHDEITGFGHEDLTLTHPTDIVIRKSDYVCSRTLMIGADKAAKDLDGDLIDDLKNEKIMEVTIKLCEK